MTLMTAVDWRYIKYLDFYPYYFKNQQEFDNVGKQVYAGFMRHSKGVTPGPGDLFPLLNARLLNEFPPIEPFKSFMGRKHQFMDPDRYEFYTPSVARFLLDTSYSTFILP
ncbi:hypothetical protein LJ656_27425 [Paraburkholderia sp. MMS20-SJTR3]|uniref:Uncharacterized protein n=1 Tax=Paraburkholderia sejongensis TaxID=2886946 RepID=A0ABS8K2D9_9BURK|nr:hypothetical protein [Paraburkholderia sp. MMS20-SJTR3]MCC8396326.1 hypothetical protein [Paraburkholderia sp. MMS20-SJTR3]